jgi:hypothetical protein
MIAFFWEGVVSADIDLYGVVLSVRGARFMGICFGVKNSAKLPM